MSILVPVPLLICECIGGLRRAETQLLTKMEILIKSRSKKIFHISALLRRLRRSGGKRKTEQSHSWEKSLGGKYRSEPRQLPGQKRRSPMELSVSIMDSHFRKKNPLEENVICSRVFRQKNVAIGGKNAVNNNLIKPAKKIK